MGRRVKKYTLVFLVVFLTAQPLLVSAQQEVRPGFDPNLLVPDAVFSDIQTFGGPEGIQNFLESKSSPLADTSPAFLARLSEPNNAALKQTLGDINPNLGRLRTAAELIWDASQTAGINPQVILVTLQKEQGLITGGVTTTPARIQRALNNAMGFACPDTTGCGQLFSGFYYQLFGNVDTENNRYLGSARSLMKSFRNGTGPHTNGRPAQVGESITLGNTLGGYAGVLAKQLITLGNSATAALYRYTPHVFNGNYNFWRFFTEWFKYPNGTIMRLAGDNNLYIIENGSRKQLLNFVAQARGISVANAINVSFTEIQNYPSTGFYSPADGTVIAVDGKIYAFFDSIKHPASPFVLAQRKIDISKKIDVAINEAAQFVDGSQLTPSDGTVLRGVTNPNVFLVQNSILKRFTEFTFKQHQAQSKVQIIPDEELLTYPNQGYVPPLDGTLVKTATSADTFVMQRGQKLPVPNELFKNLGYARNKIVTLSEDELRTFTTGTPPPPLESTVFTIAGTKELYLYKGGATHQISAFVAKQRRITPDFTFDAEIAMNWPQGIVIPPLDNTLVKSPASPAVYVVIKGQLHALTAATFKNRQYTAKQVNVIPAEDLEALPTDGFAPPVENTYFDIDSTKKLYVYQKGTARYIPAFVAKQRKITPDFTFAAEMLADWTEGKPVMPKENTLLKSSNESTVYVVIGTELRPLTAAALKRRYGANAKPNIVPAADIAAYPKGALLK